MNSKRLLCTAGAALALCAFLIAPHPSNAQARNEEQLAAILLGEVAAQQTLIAENQAKVEERVALIAEEVRLARIYSGRTGGKKGVAQ
jgi:UDP-N-acetylglucosamine:LPS N-acetylglucosamine transferase